MKEIKFYKLKDIEKGCKRRSLFSILERKGLIQGTPQYYSAKTLYIKSKILDYISHKFSAEVLEDFPYRTSGKFDTRLEREDIESLINNLEKLVSEHDITVESVNIPAPYEYKGMKILLNCDVKGNFDGDLTLFKLNTTSRFNRENAYELVCINTVATESDGERYRLIVLKLGNGDFREILENGDRTQKGLLKKNGIPEWRTLQNEIDRRIDSASEVLDGIEINPEKYNIPIFGSCATCPYHNIKITFNEMDFICVG